MTMHIVFQVNKDGYKTGQSCYVERSLARRFVENGIAITHQQHIDDIYNADQAKIKAKDTEKKAKAEKKAKVEKIEAEAKAEKEAPKRKGILKNNI